MKRELVYDLPTRIFHWMFAVLFLTAFVITKTVDDESAVFSYHMLAGLVLAPCHTSDNLRDLGHKACAVFWLCTQSKRSLQLF